MCLEKSQVGDVIEVSALCIEAMAVAAAKEGVCGEVETWMRMSNE
jgi:hypothetical protein